MSEAKKKTPGMTKRMAKSHAGIDPRKLHTLDEAVKIIKERTGKGKGGAKFDETIEIAMNLGVDPKYPDQQVRGVCSLPNGTGRTARVAVFARGPKADEAKAAVSDVRGQVKPILADVQHMTARTKDDVLLTAGTVHLVGAQITDVM